VVTQEIDEHLYQWLSMKVRVSIPMITKSETFSIAEHEGLEKNDCQHQWLLHREATGEELFCMK
jgi:hypothetical protein